jgi:hypothetical protein
MQGRGQEGRQEEGSSIMRKKVVSGHRDAAVRRKELKEFVSGSFS